MMNSDINRFLGSLLYPLCDPELVISDSLQSFFDTITTLVPTPSKLEALQKKKALVRKKAVAYLEKHYSVDSYDQVYQYLDRWYLGRHAWQNFLKDKPIDLTYRLIFDHLQALTRSMISKLDGRFIFKYWETEEDEKLLGGFSGYHKIHLFRSLNQIIPMDILAAVLVCSGDHDIDALDTFRGQVAVTDAMLERILDRGVAENHLHMNVSTNFLSVWDDLMDLGLPLHKASQLSQLKLNSPTAPPKERVDFYLSLARCLRAYLAVMTLFFDKGNPLLAEIKPGLAEVASPQWVSSCIQGLNDVSKTTDSFAEKECRLLEVIMENDAFTGTFSVPESMLPEGRFLIHTLDFFQSPYANRASNNDTGEYVSTLKMMFLNYLRIKHGIFQMMVQNKTHSGLDHFQQYYSAMSGAERVAASISGSKIGSCSKLQSRYQRLLRAQFATPHIRRVEFRTSFPDKQREALRNIREFLLAYQNVLRSDYCYYCEKEHRWIVKRPLPRVGLIFHFLKKEVVSPEVCFWQDGSAYRAYGQLHDQYKTQLNIFHELRNPEKYPGLDRFLVGIDVASLENAVPTWVFSDLFENARDSRTDTFSAAGNSPSQSLRFTFHAGEDFRHLLSGLRRIYETVHYLKFHAGDRIGHGLALGIIVDDWCKENPNVILPRIEALENYLWAYKMLSSYQSDAEAGDLLYLEQKIRQLSRDVYCSVEDGVCSAVQFVPTEILLEGYEALFHGGWDNYKNCSDECGGQGECPLAGSLPSTKEQICCAYHCQRFAAQMNEPIHYHVVPQEIRILKIVQEQMQQFISQRGIVVETNPTSNLTISSVDTLRQHPMYEISKYGYDYKNIFVCVNSDDPGVFQTNAANELGLAYMGLIEHGVGREASLRWIDQLRENGMLSSFVNQPESDEQLLIDLEDLLERFR